MEPGLYAKSPEHTAHSVHHSTLPQPPPFPLVLDFLQFLYRWKDGLIIMNEADCISPGMPRVAFWTKQGLVLCMGMTFSQPPYFSGLRRAPAAAKSLQSCPTLCDPIDGSPPGSPSLGFSRQEHWSGLPFPSPTHESEKWKWSRSVVSDPQRPHGLQPSRLLRPWDFPGRSTGVGCHCLLRECRINIVKYVRILKFHLPHTVSKEVTRGYAPSREQW